MTLLDRLFKKHSKAAIVKTAQVINEPTGVFTAYNGDAYSNDIYRGAIDAIARNIGKLKGGHVIRYAEHEKVDGDCRLNRLLQVRPNPYMSAYDLLYKMATHYYLYNNAFEVVIDDNMPADTAILGNYGVYMGYNMPEGIAVEVSRESSFRKGLIDYRALAIADCKPIVKEAFVKLEKATA